MNRRTLIAAAVFAIIAVLVVVIMQYVLHIHGGALKVAVGIVIGAIVGGVAYMTVLKPA